MSDLSLARQPAMTEPVAAATPTPTADARAPATRARISEWTLVLGLAALVLLAWGISQPAVFDPGPDAIYYLGLGGGVMMLLLFLYPLRKRVRLMHAWGATKYWFAVHMFLGIGGPLVILVHSKFQIGSVNAAVALACMLIVMVSGVIGRFIYIRIHHGLYGRHATLKELQILVGLNSIEARSKLHFAPDVEEALREFEKLALTRHERFGETALAFLALGFRGRAVYRRCARSLTARLREHARQRDWDKPKLRRRLGLAKRLARNYIHNAQRVAQFSAYERLFSLWHLLHVPFVYLLVLSAVAHVVAVHMY